jgi:hypothetical protein
VGKREGKAPFVKLRSGWEENITGYLKGVEFIFFVLYLTTLSGIA